MTNPEPHLCMQKGADAAGAPGDSGGSKAPRSEVPAPGGSSARKLRPRPSRNEAPNEDGPQSKKQKPAPVPHAEQPQPGAAQLQRGVVRAAKKELRDLGFTPEQLKEVPDAAKPYVAKFVAEKLKVELTKKEGEVAEANKAAAAAQAAAAAAQAAAAGPSRAPTAETTENDLLKSQIHKLQQQLDKYKAQADEAGLPRLE